MNFNEQEMHTLTGALYSAMEKYRECAKAIDISNMGDACKRQLIDQFNKQITDCQAVAEKIDNLNER